MTIGSTMFCTKRIHIFYSLASGFQPQFAHNQKIKVGIPPKSNKKSPIPCNYLHYKDRPVVEYTFSALKHFRRISSRSKKKAINYMAMLNFAAVMHYGNCCAKYQQRLNFGQYLADTWYG